MTDLAVITSPLLADAGARHAFFTRKGGVSLGLYAGLNVGVGSGDDPDAVLENRRLATAHLAAEALHTAYQVHSARAVVADAAWIPGQPADAVVSALPGLACGALAADCAPILMIDPQAGVVGAAHAGWKGALAGVAEAAIASMESLGARRGRIRAAVGPCIGPASYEVGREFQQRFVEADPDNARFFSSAAAPDKRMFDLPGFVLARLTAAGVAACEWVGRDTVAEPDLFYSNRRAFKCGEADYGRLLSAIVLR